MYATQPKFTAPPQHSVSPEADANRLAHIFLDERKDAKGDKVLFVQEMQSDWAQIGKKKGFQTKTTPYDDPEYKAARARATDLLNEFNRNNANPVRQQEIRPLLDEARRVEQSFEDNRQRLPSAPFVTNTEDWVNLALKRVIKEAVDNDIDTVAFIKGGQAADKYSLRTFVDYISADRGFATGDDLYVSITPKDSLSPHAFYVGPDGIIKEPISADVRSKFLGEPLSKVIGKETAEKLLSTKIGESQVLRDEGLTLGGKGMEGFYDNILPKTAEKLLKKLGGGKVEPVEMVKAAPSQMPYEANAFLHWMSFRHPGTSRSDAARAWGMGMDNNQFVKEFYEETTPKADQYLGFKITPEMKEMVKTEGLPKFAAGGEVTNDEFIQQMMTGTPMSDTTTQPGILPPEIRQAVDVPLDFANLLIRGTAAVPIGGVAGLYKGITGGKYGTQEGVKEADTEAARMMAKITGEPKTQTAKDVLQFVGDKMQEYKLDAALPQLLTLPSPGPGAASALSRTAMDKGEERMVKKMREITGNPDLTAKQVYDAMFEKQTPGASVVKMPGGNWLKGQVEYFVRPLKKDIPWTQGQLEEMPGVAKAEAPNLALNKFIETGLTRYIKNDMASAKDTLRNLADENTIKAGKAYNNDLRQVKKAYDRAEKIKAEGPRPNMLPGTWENAIEAQLGRARQLEEEANRKLNLELRHALPFPVLQEDGELAGGLNFHMRRNLQTGGKETLVSSRKEAGQAEEGVAQTPTGKVWETMADLFVKPQAAGQITDQDYFMRSTDSQRVLRNNPWLATVPPETPVYIPQDVFRSSSFLNSFSPDDLGFKHITDELANAMNPESGLPANLLLTPDEVANMGMEKAARHVIEVNKWREEQMGVANALRAQKSISLYKDYPTIPGKTEPNQRGLQWLELKLMPEDDTPESMVKAKEALADALKYEGEVMGHCVGGECPKVESGKSRIISLRDAKGEPHVTLEVIPPEVNFSDVLGGNPAFPNRDPELYRMMDTMTTTQIEKTPLYKEKAAAIAAQKLPGISQIKGKGNNRPPDSYQPFITDFIASQQWSSVGDLQNTNLVRIEPMILKNAQDRGFNPQIVTTIKERPYITKEEFNRLADLFGGMNKYAAGGEVTDFIKRAA
jgi:hypothetical protein